MSFTRPMSFTRDLLMKRNKRKNMAVPAGPPPLDKKKLWLAVALIVCVGALVYANAIKGAFVLDDGLLVQGNTYIREWKNIGKAFSEDVGEGGGGDYSFWRPLQLVTYMVDYTFWKADPTGYHLTNILLHVLAALILFWLIQLLFKDRLLALLTALLFVAHPVHTEAVTYISGRPDPLSTVFILLTLVFTVKAADTRRVSLLFLTLLSYVAALLSRENSLIVPVLFFLIGYAFRKRLPKAHVWWVSVLAGAYIVLRFTALRFLFSHHGYPTTLLERVPGFFLAFGRYLRILVLPIHLHMEYGTKTFPVTQPLVLVGLVLFAVSVFLFSRESKKRSLVFFSLSWFFITLLPVANLYPINAYMAEHWLYLPSVGFFLIVAKWFSAWLRSERARGAALTGFLIVTGLLGVLTLRQNATWLEPIAFYERTLRYAPDSSRAHSNLGMEYSHRGQTQKAAALYEKAIQLDPNNFKAHYNFGILLGDLGEKRAAEAAYKASLSIKPTYVNAINNLSKLYTEMGRYEEAVVLAKQALDHKETHLKAYNNMAIAFIRLGRERDAVAASEKVLALDPDNEKAHNNMGAAYLNLKEYDKALAVYEKLTRIAPEYPEAYHNMGLVYAAMGRWDRAVASYEKAIALRPDYARAYLNLANAYEALGEADRARAAREKSIVLDPSYAQAYDVLTAMKEEADE